MFQGKENRAVSAFFRLKDAKKGGQEVLEGKAAEKALHGGDFKDLDRTEFVGGKMQTVRKLIAKAKPPIVLAMDRDGDVRELVRRTDLQKALPKVAATSNRRETTAERAIAKASKDRAAKERRRAAAVNAAIALAVERAGQLKDEKLLSLFVFSMIRMCWNDTQMAIIKRRGLQETDKKGNVRRVPAEKCLAEHAGKLKPAELAALGLEIVLRKAAPHQNFGVNPEWPEVLKLLKIDFAKLERDIAAAAKAKAPKKKAAAKKATAKKSPKKRKGRG